MDLAVIKLKECNTPLISEKLDNHYQMLFSFTLWTFLVGGVLLLCYEYNQRTDLLKKNATGRDELSEESASSTVFQKGKKPFVIVWFPKATIQKVIVYSYAAN